MSVAAKCSHCGKAYKLADQLRGKSVFCRECGEKFVVRAAGLPGGSGSGSGEVGLRADVDPAPVLTDAETGHSPRVVQASPVLKPVVAYGPGLGTLKQANDRLPALESPDGTVGFIDRINKLGLILLISGVGLLILGLKRDDRISSIVAALFLVGGAGLLVPRLIRPLSPPLVPESWAFYGALVIGISAASALVAMAYLGREALPVALGVVICNAVVSLLFVYQVRAAVREEGWGEAALVNFVPGYIIVFALRRWDDVGRPFMIGVSMTAASVALLIPLIKLPPPAPDAGGATANQSPTPAPSGQPPNDATTAGYKTVSIGNQTIVVPEGWQQGEDPTGGITFADITHGRSIIVSATTVNDTFRMPDLKMAQVDPDNPKQLLIGKSTPALIQTLEFGVTAGGLRYMKQVRHSASARATRAVQTTYNIDLGNSLVRIQSDSFEGDTGWDEKLDQCVRSMKPAAGQVVQTWEPGWWDSAVAEATRRATVFDAPQPGAPDPRPMAPPDPPPVVRQPAPPPPIDAPGNEPVVVKAPDGSELLNWEPDAALVPNLAAEARFGDYAFQPPALKKFTPGGARGGTWSGTDGTGKSIIVWFQIMNRIDRKNDFPIAPLPQGTTNKNLRVEYGMVHGVPFARRAEVVSNTVKMSYEAYDGDNHLKFTISYDGGNTDVIKALHTSVCTLRKVEKK